MEITKVLNDFVVIEQDSPLKATESGIILPDEVDQETPPTGTVYSGTPEIPIGSRVLFKPHMFDDLTLNKKQYKVGKSENIVAILQ